MLGALLLSALAAAASAAVLPPETYLSTPELIVYNGFVAENHTVVTADNFTLHAFRIPNPGAPAVLLQHGLQDSSDAWVVNPRNESLAFLLADAGFDVFLGNNRGNKYSPPDCPPTPVSGGAAVRACWKFGWEEMAEYDVPAHLEYITKLTGQPSVGYVGHSEGTTQMITYLSMADFHASTFAKLNVAVLLAPVAWIGNIGIPLYKYLADHGGAGFLERIGLEQFPPATGAAQTFLPNVCAENPTVCDTLFEYQFGQDVSDLNQTRIPVYEAHMNAGSSARAVEHYVQLMRSGNFTRFDFGEAGNMAKYGQPTPPAYPVASSSVPPGGVHMFSGGVDRLGDPRDVATLEATFPMDSSCSHKQIPTWGHVDFLYTMHPDVVYTDVVAKLKAAVPGARTIAQK